MPIDRTKAIIRILKRGALKPPKNPTIRINKVARVIMAGIDQIMPPILPLNTQAATTDDTTITNIEMAIQ